MKKVFYILMCATLALPMVSCNKNSSKTSSSETSSSETSTPYIAPYKRFKTALNDGKIYEGMTYKEIEQICGKAESLSYSQGKVQFAYYGNYQLCFDSYGGYMYYNYRQ